MVHVLSIPPKPALYQARIVPSWFALERELLARV